MGFVNEPMPRDQRQTYEIPDYRAITPGRWTVDKERDIFLFIYWTNIDNPSEKYFAFYWKNVCFKAVMWSSFVDDNTIEWGLLSLEQAEKKDLLINKQEVLNDLREAFKVYGVSGYRFPVPNAIPRPSTKVIISF